MGIGQTDTYAQSGPRWTVLGSFTTNVWLRCYIWAPAFPNVIQSVMRTNDNAGSASGGVSISTAGLIQAKNAAGGIISGGTGAIPIPLASWFRLEARILSSTTAGEVEWRSFYDPDSTVATETRIVTGQVLAANSDQAFYGHLGGSGITAQTWYFNDCMVSSTDWIGPSRTPRETNAFE